MTVQSKVLTITLPPIPSGNREAHLKWRLDVWERARAEATRLGLPLLDGECWFNEKVEVEAVIYLPQEESDESFCPDIDNFLKALCDALQGALGRSAKGSTKSESRDKPRTIRSDKQIYRVAAEKRHERGESGGQVSIRPYSKNAPSSL